METRLAGPQLARSDNITRLDDLKGREVWQEAEAFAAAARKMIGEGVRRKDVAELFKVNRATLYRALNA